MGIPTFSRFMASFRQQNHCGCSLGLIVPVVQKAHRAFFPGAGGSKEPASTGEKHGKTHAGVTRSNMVQHGSTRFNQVFNQLQQE